MGTRKTNRSKVKENSEALHWKNWRDGAFELPWKAERTGTLSSRKKRKIYDSVYKATNWRYKEKYIKSERKIQYRAVNFASVSWNIPNIDQMEIYDGPARKFEQLLATTRKIRKMHKTTTDTFKRKFDVVEISSEWTQSRWLCNAVGSRVEHYYPKSKKCGEHDQLALPLQQNLVIGDRG